MKLHIPSAVVSDAIAAELLAGAGATPSELQSNIDQGSEVAIARAPRHAK